MACFGWLDCDRARQNKEYRALSKRLWNGGNEHRTDLIIRDIMGNFFCVGIWLVSYSSVRVRVCVSFFFFLPLWCLFTCQPYISHGWFRITANNMLVDSDNAGDFEIALTSEKSVERLLTQLFPPFLCTLLTLHIYYYWGPTTPWPFCLFFYMQTVLVCFFLCVLTYPFQQLPSYSNTGWRVLTFFV